MAALSNAGLRLPNSASFSLVLTIDSRSVVWSGVDFSVIAHETDMLTDLDRYKMLTAQLSHFVVTSSGVLDHLMKQSQRIGAEPTLLALLPVSTHM